MRALVLLLLLSSCKSSDISWDTFVYPSAVACEDVETSVHGAPKIIECKLKRDP